VAVLGAQNKTPSPSPPPPAPTDSTRFSQRLNHAALASPDFAIQILWCRLQDLRLLLFHCSELSINSAGGEIFCNASTAKFCAAKELKGACSMRLYVSRRQTAAKRPSACLLKWVCNRRATDVQRVARSPKCTGAFSPYISNFLCKKHKSHSKAAQNDFLHRKV
jgi:hypothetical protein